jgi:ribonuclease VapC
MIVVDASALLAILLNEPEAEKILHKLNNTETKIIAAPTVLETCMAAKPKLGPLAVEEVKFLLDLAIIETVDFTVDASEVAIAAFLKYGKGQGHPAKLNFGDCMSYALSKIEGLPLLYKGNDFLFTDVASAI